MTFWSRSRQEYWRKGDTSGNIQLVRGARLDCDGDADPGRGRPGRARPATPAPARASTPTTSHAVRGARPAARDDATRSPPRRRSRPSPWARSASSRPPRPGCRRRSTTARSTRSRCPARPPFPSSRPLSLAVLALGAALSIVGLVLRYVFGALTVAIAALLGWLTRAGRVRRTRRRPSPRRSPTATGITGEDAVAALVARRSRRRRGRSSRSSRWLVLLAGGVFTLATARSWRGSGRRYRTDAPPRRPTPRHRRPARTTRSTRGTTSRVARIRPTADPARLATHPRVPGGIP